MLDMDPEKRPPSALHVSAELSRLSLLTDVPPPSEPTSRRSPTGRWARTRIRTRRTPGGCGSSIHRRERHRRRDPRGRARGHPGRVGRRHSPPRPRTGHPRRAAPRVRRGLDAQRAGARRHRPRRTAQRRVRSPPSGHDPDEPGRRPAGGGHRRRGHRGGGAHADHRATARGAERARHARHAELARRGDTVTALDLLDNISDTHMPDIPRIDEAGEADTALDMRLDHVLSAAPAVEAAPPAEPEPSPSPSPTSRPTSPAPPEEIPVVRIPPTTTPVGVPR